ENVPASEIEKVCSIAEVEFSKVSVLLTPYKSNALPASLLPSLPYSYVSCSVEYPFPQGISQDSGPALQSSLTFKEKHSLVSQVSMSSLESKPQISKTLLFTEKAKMLFSQSRSLFSPQ
ncbi:hypothetical protein HMI54_014076, partial [Coelomomyces lativittatus]